MKEKEISAIAAKIEDEQSLGSKMQKQVMTIPTTGTMIMTMTMTMTMTMSLTTEMIMTMTPTMMIR